MYASLQSRGPYQAAEIQLQRKTLAFVGGAYEKRACHSTTAVTVWGTGITIYQAVRMLVTLLYRHLYSMQTTVLVAPQGVASPRGCEGIG